MRRESVCVCTVRIQFYHTILINFIKHYCGILLLFRGCQGLPELTLTVLNN